MWVNHFLTWLLVVAALPSDHCSVVAGRVAFFAVLRRHSRGFVEELFFLSLSPRFVGPGRDLGQYDCTPDFFEVPRLDHFLLGRIGGQGRGLAPRTLAHTH